MRLLLDTHVLLWALSEPDRIPPGIREAIEAAENEVVFSAASIWEIAIKAGVGQLKLGMPVEESPKLLNRRTFRNSPCSPFTPQQSPSCHSTIVIPSTCS